MTWLLPSQSLPLGPFFFFSLITIINTKKFLWNGTGKGTERGPLSACIDMPLPLCKYLLTSLKFSYICGKILHFVCVCVLLTSFGDALPACQGTGEHTWSSDCFHGRACIRHRSVCVLVAYPLGSACCRFSPALMDLFRSALQRFRAVMIPGLPSAFPPHRVGSRPKAPGDWPARLWPGSAAGGHTQALVGIGSGCGRALSSCFLGILAFHPTQSSSSLQWLTLG